MAQTQYITIAEWQLGIDDRVLAQLAADDGSLATIAANSVLLNCIDRASADVESYALRGGRYSEADLAALDTDADWTLKGLVVDLATGYLYETRGGTAPPDVERKITRSKETLEALGNGSRIFRDAGAISGGRAQVKVISAAQRGNLRMVSDQPFFPTRLETVV